MQIFTGNYVARHEVMSVWRCDSTDWIEWHSLELFCFAQIPYRMITLYCLTQELCDGHSWLHVRHRSTWEDEIWLGPGLIRININIALDAWNIFPISKFSICLCKQIILADEMPEYKLPFHERRCMYGASTPIWVIFNNCPTILHNSPTYFQWMNNKTNQWTVQPSLGTK